MNLKKVIYKKIVWVLVLVFCMSSVSCTGDGVYTVSFDYGYGDKVLTEDVLSGNAAKKPDTPMRIGYEFDGWWIKDEDGERLWDFEKDVVTKDLTLYARWVDSSEKPYTIKLDPNGGVCELDEIEVFYGKEYSLPIPTKEGYYFLHWNDFIPNEGIWKYDGYSSLRATWQNFPVGMTVKMGKFEQDNDLTNGEEDIIWEVINYEDGKYFLFSRHILAAMSFQKDGWDGTYDTSRVREWMNEEFYANHFTAEEKKYIEYTDLEDAPTDKIVCLSVADLRRIGDVKIIGSQPTAYALSMGIGWDSYTEKEDGSREIIYPYYLISGKCATQGVGEGSGPNIAGVRPAMWISEEYLESLK